MAGGTSSPIKVHRSRKSIMLSRSDLHKILDGIQKVMPHLHFLFLNYYIIVKFRVDKKLIMTYLDL